MHIGKTWLLALKDIMDLPGANDYTHVNSTLLKKNAFFKIYRGSPLGTIHCWSWIMQEFLQERYENLHVLNIVHITMKTFRV